MAGEPASGSEVIIELQPLGVRLAVPRGASLIDHLFAHGVEFACGGRGRCKGCRVKVLKGALPITLADGRNLTPAQLAEGWRLSCRARADSDLVLELAQWEMPILSDDSPINFTAQPGLGVAVDLGTTTIVAQLIDLGTGQVLGVCSALNRQAQHGSDIMSRIEFALADGEGMLLRMIRGQIGEMVAGLLAEARVQSDDLKRVVLAGNTIMHHLFCGRAVAPLAQHPFETGEGGLQRFPAADLAWGSYPNCQVEFLPCIGSFVGSDILAGVLAARLHEADELSVFIDLGTNGEMVVGDRHRLLCASTAAGPAFEGARISAGMRAVTGAISEVTVAGASLQCRVIGGGIPRGICGSGLVDAVSAALELGALDARGCYTGEPLRLARSVVLTQADVRELQLAKAAIAAGVRLLLRRLNATPGDVRHVFLAGAFGNYINRTSAWRIGLIDFEPDHVKPVGNTALLGAKVALFAADREYAQVRSAIEHVPLADEPEFQDVFVDELTFPAMT